MQMLKNSKVTDALHLGLTTQTIACRPLCWGEQQLKRY